MNDQALTSIVASSPVDVTIASWIAAKQKKSQSAKTRSAYEQTIFTFRAALMHEGLDLDSVSQSQDRQRITLLAQVFAGWSTRGKEVATATYNQRLAILSSFYTYAKQRDVVEYNPIEKVERAKVQQYANAQPLDLEATQHALQRIDRSTPLGKRDYALLTLLLQTGRRLSEVQGLKWGDISLASGKVTITFDCKGNKKMHDALPRPTAEALLTWIHCYYGRALGKLPKETPIWISLAKGPSYGQALGIGGIAKMCEKHLGTSKVHKLRHTWAHTMEDIGASASIIQARLGHESLATTGRYLAALKSAENKYAEKLAAAFGIE